MNFNIVFYARIAWGMNSDPLVAVVRRQSYPIDTIIVIIITVFPSEEIPARV
jgi:hypothetical protein